MRHLAYLMVLWLAAGCGDEVRSTENADGGADPVGGGGPGGEGPGGMNAGGAGGDGGEGGEMIEPRPDVPTACATPVATLASQWDAENTRRFDALDLAWTGTDAALLFAESTGELTWRVTLQRLSPLGTPVGAPTLVGDLTIPDAPIGFREAPAISLAARGQNYVACWGGAAGGGQVACAIVDPADTVTVGLTTSGKHPSVAMGPAGVGLVYIDGPELTSQLLATDATALGGAHVVATSSPDFPFVPYLAAADHGYLANVDIFFSRFDAAFEEQEGQSASGWTSLRVSHDGTGNLFGAAWGSLDGVRARVLGPDDEDFGADIRIDGGVGSTSAAPAAITRADASFATVWQADDELHYAAIDLTANPIGQPVAVGSASRNPGSVTLIGVADGFLAAGLDNTSLDRILVYHLACAPGG